MSTRNHTLIEGAAGLISRGKSNTPTETAVDLADGRGVVTLTQTARRPAAGDVTVTTKLSAEEARALRDELADLVERVDGER